MTESGYSPGMRVRHTTTGMLGTVQCEAGPHSAMVRWDSSPASVTALTSNLEALEPPAPLLPMSERQASELAQALLAFYLGGRNCARCGDRLLAHDARDVVELERQSVVITSDSAAVGSYRTTTEPVDPRQVRMSVAAERFVSNREQQQEKRTRAWQRRYQQARRRTHRGRASHVAWVVIGRGPGRTDLERCPGCGTHRVCDTNKADLAELGLAGAQRANSRNGWRVYLPAGSRRWQVERPVCR